MTGVIPVRRENAPMSRLGAQDGRAEWPAAKWRDRQITSEFQKSCQAVGRKIFPLPRRANQNYNSRHPVPSRGALAIVANVGQGAMDARLRKTSAVLAYGEIVWVRRPGAGVKSWAKAEAAMVAIKPVTRTKSYKP